jgi:hypothetical protein
MIDGGTCMMRVTYCPPSDTAPMPHPYGQRGK